MFESLSDKLQNVFKRLRGKGSLTEADVAEALREVRLALLEADVNFRVVKEFIGRVKERAVGRDVLESLTPAQMVIKIVDEELTAILGGEESRINFAPRPPTVIMMVGLQGSGTGCTGGLGVSGFILTELDGDTRGGAAISIRAVAGQPIKFVGVGEKPEAIEPFHPDRMASRILGMGDVLSLIEKAEAVIDEK